MGRLSEVAALAAVTILLLGVEPASADSWHLRQWLQVEAQKTIELPKSLRIELPVPKDVRYGQVTLLLGGQGLGGKPFEVVLEHDRADGPTERLLLTDTDEGAGSFRGSLLGPDGEKILRRYREGDFLIATLSFRKAFKLKRGGQLAMELFLTDQNHAAGFEPPAARAETNPRAKWWLTSTAELNHLGGQQRATKHPRSLAASMLVPDDFGPSHVCFSYGSGLIGNHGKVKRIKTTVDVLRENGSRSRYRTKIQPNTSVPSRPQVRWCLEQFPDLARGDRLAWTHKFLGRKGKIDNQLFAVFVFAPASVL